MPTVDEYLAAITPAQRVQYERLRTLVKREAPDATESLSYGVPTFKLRGKPLIYFGAFKHHMSIYPASDEMIEAVGKGLDKLRASKGTLRFTDNEPVSDHVLKEIIIYRMGTIT